MIDFSSIYSGASWFLSKISIDDPIRRMIYDIPCNAWLSSKSNDQKTMRSFIVVSKTSSLNSKNSKPKFSRLKNFLF
jgi:hypothetical protein